MAIHFKVLKPIIMNKIKYFSLLLAVFFMYSCGSDMKNYKESSSGKTCELMVVGNPDVWRNISDRVKEILGKPIVGLPQREPTFDVVFLPENSFNDMFKKHRNILMLNIDEKLQKSSVEYNEDVFSAPQFLIKINSNNYETLVKVIEANQEFLIEKYHESEIRRVIAAYNGIENLKIKEIVKKEFNLNMIFPNNYYLAKKTEDFVWFRSETKEISQNVCIYYCNYTDTNMFSQKKILALRDTLTKKHIPGSFEGTYMKTASEVITPQSFKIELDKKYCIETRGIWDVYKDFMGGPYINYVFVDPKNNRFYMVDGFVYAPKYDKRDYLLQVEGIIKSLKTM